MSDSQLQAPTNGAEQRLDLILEELRGIRAALQHQQPTPRPVEMPSGQVELREPRVLGRRPRGAVE